MVKKKPQKTVSWPKPNKIHKQKTKVKEANNKVVTKNLVDLIGICKRMMT
jgi:hypothetical protein